MSSKDYGSLSAVLAEAFLQASAGKGRTRHASVGEPFDKQPICEMARRLGVGGPLYQAVKKIYESERLAGEAGVAELLGAINYIAAAIIVRREEE
jgi:transposase InsO family protein